MSALSRIAAASLLVATVALVPMATSAEAQRFIPDIIISSTIPANGDLNPYGVALVPPNFPEGGAISPGDILVSNFNDKTNTQGNGTTIIKLTPNAVVTPPPIPPSTAGNATVFFTSPAELGLTTALGVLERGFVVVGNLPNSLQSPGSLQLIDRNGRLVETITDPLIDGPWDLTVDDDFNHPTIYISNVLNGTVVRLNITLPSKKFSVTQIASGYTVQPNSSALILGPTGLAHDRVTDILYVASTADNAIFKVFNASTRSTPPSGKGTGVIIATGGQLRGPLALAFAPNGDLITSNGDAVNADANHPSEIVELTKTGQFVGQFNVDAAQGGAFGLATTLVGLSTVRLAAVDDNANDLIVIDQQVVPGD
jgi:hypothetical protein